MPQVPQLRALGGLRLEPMTFSQPKPLLLLAYLALEGAQQRRRLAELFWPGGNRMKSLSMTLTRLRQGAGDVVLADERQAWATSSSDAAALLDALDQSDWQRAQELYSGAFLEGVILDDWSAELEEWVLATREYLAGRVQHALLSLAEDAARDGAFDRAAELAARAYRLPGQGAPEVSALKRLYLLLSAGHHAHAREVRRELRDYEVELELSPVEARAALRSWLPGIPSNLVPRGTTFIGRAAELERAAALLEPSTCRLVTLIGAGGVGKSRLAQEIAQAQLRSGRYPDGVYLVLLDALTEPAQLPAQVLQVLGAGPQGHGPGTWPPGNAWEALADALAGKRMLLVLDNVEQVARAAAGLHGLLRATTGVDLLVTSRVRLDIEEEHLFPVGALAYPDGPVAWEEAQRYDAVRLFAERARQLRPEVQLEPEAAHVCELCRRLEGLPLGIELAAAWIRLLSCAEIAAEVEGDLDFLASTMPGLPERHRSVRGMLEASWKLLSDRERQVLRALAVFRGGFRREAASVVAGATLSVLAGLVDKSLLRAAGNGRYDRHPLLFQFTLEQLALAPDELREAEARHAAYYLRFAEQADALLRTREQISWFARMDEEIDNAAAALDVLEAGPNAEAGLRLGLALSYFWRTRGRYQEALDHLERNLARTAGASPARVRALLEAGNLALQLGRHRPAELHYARCLAEALPARDDAVRVEALLGLGSIHASNRGDAATAATRYRAALALARELGEPLPIAHALRRLGTLHMDMADYRAAKACFEESVDLCEAGGDPFDRAKGLINLATVLGYLGEHQRAHRLNQQTLALCRAVGDRHGEGMALLNLAMDASGGGGDAEALHLYRRSLAIYRDLGDVRMVSHLLNNIAGVLQKRGHPRQALPLLDESLALQRRIGEVTLEAHALFLLAQVQEDLGERELAHGSYLACIALCRRSHDNWSMMRALERLARWYLRGADVPAATEALDEAERLATAAGDRSTLGRVRETRARLATVTASRLGSEYDRG